MSNSKNSLFSNINKSINVSKFILKVKNLKKKKKKTNT